MDAHAHKSFVWHYLQVDAVVDGFILCRKVSLAKEWADRIYYEQIYPK